MSEISDARWAQPLTRRTFAAGLVAAAGSLGLDVVDAIAADEPPARHTPTPQETLDLLLAGNRRFASGRARHPHQSVARRRALAAGQKPIAAVCSCIDSRVPPELVFDQGLGDLFAIRTAAQALSDVVIGSVEYGPAVLGTPLVVVLGHEGCGAIKAAIDSIRTGKPAPGHLPAVVAALRPAYEAALKEGGELVPTMTRAQTRLTVARLEADPVLTPHVDAGRLRIVGGYYHLGSGLVELLT